MTTVPYAFSIGSGVFGQNQSNVYYTEVGTSWHQTTSYPHNYTSPVCTEYDGYVYCIGGESNVGCSSSYEGCNLTDTIYSAQLTDTGIPSWSYQGTFPEGLEYTTYSGLSCVTYSGYIYCYSSYNSGIIYFAPISGGTVGTWTYTAMYAPTQDIPANNCAEYNGWMICGSYSPTDEFGDVNLNVVRTNATNTLNWMGFNSSSKHYYAIFYDIYYKGDYNVSQTSYLCASGEAYSGLPLVVSAQGTMYALGSNYLPWNSSASYGCSGYAFGNSTIYQFGLNTSGGNPLVEAYDIEAQPASALYPLSVTVPECNFLPGGNELYCLGGNNFSETPAHKKQFYEAAAGSGISSWTQLQDLPIKASVSDLIIASLQSPSTTTTTTTSTITTSFSSTVVISCSVYGNTKVLLANGTYIKAAQLEPGMAVMSYNPVANSSQPSVISGIFKGHALNRYIFNNNLTVDSEETMLINGTWMLAGNSKVGDTAYDPLIKRNMTITSINITYNGGTVYDIYDQPINNFITYGGYVVDGITSSTKSGCSVVGSDVAMLANGSYVPVSKIKVGESLMSYDLKSQRAAPTVVTGIQSFNVTQLYMINNNLTVDAAETLLVNGNFSTAANLKIGDLLFNPISGKNITVKELDIINTTSRVYDIDAAPIDAYVVNGYLIT